MKLLDGSLSAGNTNITGSGPKFGVYDTAIKAFITSNVCGVKIDISNSAAVGGESAIWDARLVRVYLVFDPLRVRREQDSV